MKKTRVVAALLLVSGLWSAPNARAQAASEKKPRVISESQAVLETWNDVSRKLIAMAEDFPEDKYDFKPNPTQRSFAEQLLHAAGSTYYFTNLVKGEKPPTEESPKREAFKTKADIVAYVKKAFVDGSDAIKSKGEKGMGDMLTDPFSHDQVRVADFAYGFIEHSGEHYGQLVVYYRVTGLVPPESRPKK
jgi:uncharacterized damage-inducible protein DinB